MSRGLSLSADSNGSKRIPLKILVVTLGFGPWGAVTAILVYQLAGYLASLGYEVTVFTAKPRRPQGSVEVGENGVTVIHGGPVFAPDAPYWKKIAGTLRFHLRFARRFLARSPKLDLVITCDEPIFVGFLPSIAEYGRLMKTKHLVWARDLWAEQHLISGKWKANRWLHRKYVSLHNWIYKYSSQVVVVGSDVAERVRQKGVPASRIKIIPAWADYRCSPQAGHIERLNADLQIAGKFVVLYSGHLGKAHDYQCLTETMRLLVRDTRIAFLFAGAGVGYESVRTLATEQNWPNVRFLGLVSHEVFGALMARANVSLAALRDEYLGTCVPGKVYGAMEAGKAQIFLGPETCQSAREILEAQAGCVVPNGDPERLARTISSLAEDPVALETMGLNARVWFDANNGKKCLEAWGACVSDLIGLPFQSRE